MRVSLDTERLVDQAFGHAANLSLSDPTVHTAIRQHHQAYLEQQVALDTAGLEHFQSAVQRAGLHWLQSTLYQSGGSIQTIFAEAQRAPKSNLPNWELVAAVELLATLNLRMAKQMLPEKIRELAEEWPWVKAWRQLEICEALFVFLGDFQRTEKQEEVSADDLDLSTAWCRDYLRQEPQRIFPKYFLKDRSVEPNCLGKAQMLLAFFEVAQANVVGLTPVTLSEEAVHATLGHLADAILHFATEAGAEVSEKLSNRFAKRKKAAAILNSAPGRFHMAVAVELADSSWFVIDPHMQVRGVISNPLELNFASQMIDLLSPVLPGFCSLSGEGGGIEKATFSASMAAGRIIDLWTRMHQQWKDLDFHPAAAIPLFGTSPVLDLFLKEGIGVLERDQEIYQRLLAGEETAIFAFRRGPGMKMHAVDFRTSSGRELTEREKMRMQVAMSVLSYLAIESKKDLDRLDDFQLHASGFRKVLEILPSLAYKHAAKEMGVTAVGGRLLHPHFEVYEPKFRVGIELLAHLNAIGVASGSTVMELAAICGGQHHLALAATEEIRSGNHSSATAWAAIDVLQNSPITISVAGEVLLELKRQGVLCDSQHNKDESIFTSQTVSEEPTHV